MAAPSWSKIPVLIRSLLENGCQYDLYLALYFLEKYWSGDKTLEKGLRQRVKIIPDENLSFPASDIRKCRIDLDKKRVELVSRFSGLYGLGSPLPQYFIESALGQHDFETHDYDEVVGQRVRAFLDIFNHHLYCLGFAAWKKYQPLVEGCGQEDYLNIRTTLGGERANGNENNFYGLNIHRSESASATELMIAQLLPGYPVAIDDHIAQWVVSDEVAGIGGNCVLGESSMLGQRMLVVGGKFRIEIGPINSELCKPLLPGEPLSQKLSAQLEKLVKPSLDFEVVLTVKAERAPQQAMTGNSLQLGNNTWLGENPAMEKRIRISRKQLKKQIMDQPITLAQAA